jgi:septin family protein
VIGSGSPHPTTIYGETLGRLDLLVFGRKGAGKTALANTLVDANNEDIVINDGWDRDRRVLSATTVASRHGSHQTSNVTITEVDGFDEEDSMVCS